MAVRPRWNAPRVRSGRLVVVLLLLAGWASAAPPQQRLTIAAASDLSIALPEIAKAFSAATGVETALIFGASGTLTRQIESGAPFDLFLSADESFIARLHAAGLTRDSGALYAIGRLALFAPLSSTIDVAAGLDGLAAAVAAGRVNRFAIANPALAPYGRAAEAALRSHGLWQALQPAIVLGENVSQAAQFATAGGAAGGIIAHSLAVSPALVQRGRFALIADTLHPPLLQRMVVLARAGPTAGRFFEFMREPPARAILARHGFDLPPM
jgi:molybdate transport system substrate-binding protein